MKIDERNERLLKALHAVMESRQFTANDAMGKCAGNAAREPVGKELLLSIAGCVGRNTSAVKLGKRLQQLVGIAYGDLELDGFKVSNKWNYRIAEISKRPVIENPLKAIMAEKEAFEDKLDGMPPLKAIREMELQQKRDARLREKIRKEDEREYAKEENRALRAEIRKAEQEAEQTRRDEEAGAIVLWVGNNYMTMSEAKELAQYIGPWARVHGTDMASVKVILHGTPEEKRRDMLLIKNRIGERGLNFQSIPAELMEGFRAGFSQDPADYGDYSTRRAIQLLNAGDTTTPLDAARRTRNTQWNAFDITLWKI